MLKKKKVIPPDASQPLLSRIHSYLNNYHRAFLVLLLWSLFASAHFYILGFDSFIAIYDECDANVPSSFAVQNNPHVSEDAGWYHFFHCGSPASYTQFSVLSPFYIVMLVLKYLFISLVSFKFLQIFIASVSMFLLARIYFKISPLIALGMAFFYSTAPIFQEFRTFHQLSMSLPLFILSFELFLKLKNTYYKYFLFITIGLFFSITNTLFVTYPNFIIYIFLWLIFVSKHKIKEYLFPYIVFSTISVIPKLYVAAVIYDTAKYSYRLAEYSSNYQIQEQFISTLINIISRIPNDRWLDQNYFLALIPIILFSIIYKSYKERQIFIFFVFTVLFSLFHNFYLLLSLFIVPLHNILLSANIIKLETLLTFNVIILSGLCMEYLMRKIKLRRTFSTYIFGLIICLSIVYIYYIPAIYGNYRYLQEYNYINIPILDNKLFAVFLLGILSSATIAFILWLTRKSILRKNDSYYRFLLVFLFIIAGFLNGALNVASGLRMAQQENYRAVFMQDSYSRIAGRFTPEQPFRVATAFAHKLIPPNSANAYNLETVDGYWNLNLLRYHFFWKAIVQPMIDKNTFATERFSGHRVRRFFLFHPDADPVTTANVPPSLTFADCYNLQLLSLANVKYIFSYWPIEDPRLRFIEGSKESHRYVYENTTYMDRFFMVRDVVKCSGLDAVYDSLKVSSVEKLYHTVFLDSQVVPEHIDLSTDTTELAYQIDVQRYESDLIELEVTVDEDVLLVVTNSYIPHWVAEVDGVETEVIPVDGTFQGVWTPAGTQRVVLRYTRKFIL